MPARKRKKAKVKARVDIDVDVSSWIGISWSDANAENGSSFFVRKSQKQ